MRAAVVRVLLVPILVVAASQLLRPLLNPWMGAQVTPVQMFSFLAVFVAAWTGGLWAGVVATPLAIAAGYLQVELGGGATVPPPEGDVARILFFCLISLVFSVLTEARLRAHDRLAAQRDALEGERARFRELADSMPQIVWSSRGDGTMDYINRRWEELVGTRAWEPGGATLVHDEDRPRVLEAWRRARESGEPFEIEFRLNLPTPGEPRWFLGRSLPVRDADGRVVRWYGTSTDIHEQKKAAAELAESRERLRAALDASTTGTFQWRIDTNALDWDENLDRLLGLASGATSHTLDEVLRMVHPDDRQRVIDACRRCADHGADFEEEFRVAWPDGTIRWLYDKGRVYAQGGVRYMAGACVDVTERRRKEDALREADRQKDEFLGMLAHELRNPLAPMMYSLAMLEQRTQDPALTRPLAVMSRQVRRMTRIVDDLLDVSRVTQGKVSLKRELLDVVRTVADAVEATRGVIESRKHTLALDMTDAALVISGDAMRLAQVLENVLHNAAKYTPEGGRITVSVRREGRQAAISVADTGVGIAPATLPRVFDLFMQADTSLDRSEGGLGIGLTLVQRLVRMHGGTVEARSDGLGRGSEFLILLPLANAELPTERPQAPSTALDAHVATRAVNRL